MTAIVRGGLTYSEEPYALSHGELSNYFIDSKAALAEGDDQHLVCEAMIAAVAELGVEYDAVGGLTMGADMFAHHIAPLAHKRWFVVRKERKGRGTNKLIEGAALGSGTRVLLVDDVVTTGGSIEQAYDEVTASGATVVAAVTLVDRGESAQRYFADRSIPYAALVTYRDLGIPMVGSHGDRVSA